MTLYRLLSYSRYCMFTYLHTYSRIKCQKKSQAPPYQWNHRHIDLFHCFSRFFISNPFCFFSFIQTITYTYMLHFTCVFCWIYQNIYHVYATLSCTPCEWFFYHYSFRNIVKIVWQLGSEISNFSLFQKCICG